MAREPDLRLDVLSLLEVRSDVSRAIYSSFETLVGGEGACLVVSGETGSGKSQVLAAIAELAEAGDARLVNSKATQIDEMAPLASLVPALANSDPPVLDRATLGRIRSNHGSAIWIVEELAEAIQRAADEGPVCVLLDDLHWADELSLLALRMLVPRFMDLPVLWAMTVGPASRTAVGQVVASLGVDGAVLLELEPLTSDQARQVCQIVLGGAPDGQIQALLDGCEGNLFFILEVLSQIEAHGKSTSESGLVALADGGAFDPIGLRSVLRGTIQLSSAARRLLDFAAVLGRPFAVDEMARIMRLPVAETTAVVDESIQAGLLRYGRGGIDFRHLILRQAIAENLGESSIAGIHQAISAALQAEAGSGSDVSIGEAASHGMQAPLARAHRAEALRLVDVAVEKLAATLPGAAADLLQDALAISDPKAKPQLVAMIVRLLAAAGRNAEAIELGEGALRDAVSPADQVRISLGLWDAMKYVGHSHDVVHLTGPIVDHQDVPEDLRANALAVRAHSQLRLGNLEMADAESVAAAQLASEVGAREAEVYAMTARSVVLRSQGHLSEAVAVAEQAVELVEEGGLEAQRRHPRLWLARALQQSDRFEESRRVFDTSLRETELLGTSWALPLWHFYYADMLLNLGRLEDCSATAQTGLRMSRQLGSRGIEPPLLLLLTRVAIWRGELAVARGHMETLDGLQTAAHAVPRNDLLLAKASLLRAESRPEEAFELLGELYEEVPLLTITQDPTLAITLVLLANRNSASQAARAVSDAVGELADKNPSIETFQALRLLVSSLLRKDAELANEGIRLVTQLSDRPLLVALGNEVGGITDYATGDLDRGKQRFLDAAAIYERMGAHGAKAALETECRARRIELGSVVERREPQGWSALTPAERRVAWAVAEGRTNRAAAEALCLSPHTIDSHLRHAYAKLGISSRVALTRIAMENPAPAEEVA